MDRFSSARLFDGPPAKPCAFCDIAGGKAGARLVLETDACVAFLDRSPLALGHVLLVPRGHVETLPEADDATAPALMLALRDLTRAVPQAVGADGSFVAENNVVSQSVPHLHFHVVPRSRGDKLFAYNLTWKRVRYASEAEMDEVAGRIRQALG